MQTEAPNFSGTYPLAGEKIGPAWRDLWAMLTTDTWQSGAALAAEIGPRHDLLPETVKNLLRTARAAGLLEVRQQVRPGGTRASAHYRVRTS